jgi:hypothetical protein
MSLIRSLITPGRPRERSEAGFLSMDDFANLLTLGNFPLFMNQTLRTDREEIDAGFAGLVSGAYRSNGIVFACILARMLLFSEARFQFQQMRGGRPGDLFGTPELGILERPEPGKTTGDLLTRAIIDVDLAGNWFGVRRPNRIKRLRPDWVTIVLGSTDRDADVTSVDIDAEVIGYIYKPGGRHSSEEPEALERGEVAHFAPIPDPLASYRGMSWLTPIIREIQADSSATQHKGAFFSNAAPQPLDARVLTPEGWTTMGSMEVGDRVIGRDGQTHEVLGVYPQGEQDIYRVTFSDGAATECTANHLWEVASIYDRKRGITRTMPLAQIMAGGPAYRSGPRKWSVPLPEPIGFDDPGPLPMAPYLLGVMLGDGSFRNGAVTFSTADPEIVESVRELVPAGVEVVHQKEYSYHLRAGSRGVKRHPMIALAKSLGLWNVIGYEKAVPEPYLRASVFDREALLQGLMDTDGSVSGLSGTALRFDNTSETLARQVVELARSLGGRATIRRTKDRPETPNRRPQWTVWISRLPDWITPVRLARKRARYHVPTGRALRHRYIVAIEPVGRKFAQCIYVDSPEHLYVTDDYIVTHNTPNLVVKFPALTDPSVAKEFIETFEQDHSGAFNAYRTLFLLGGANIEAVGRDFQQMDFKATQGAGETRIAAAAGMHPTIVGLSEGLQGSSLNAGNFDAAARITANKTLRPMWRNMAGSLETIVSPPPGSRLWYDDRDIPFLAEDIKVAAEVMGVEAQAIRTLSDGGFLPQSVVDAVVSGDLRRLSHSGFLSVQMNPSSPPGESEGARLLVPGFAYQAGGPPLLESGEIRCPSCDKLLAERATPPYRFTCTNSHCKAVVEAA